MNAAPTNARTKLAATMLLLWAAGLRVWHIGAQSLWSDEGNSVWMLRRSWSEIWQAAAADIHPPLYYMLLQLWGRMLGNSELAVRLLSAWAAVLSLAAVFWLGRRWQNYRVGLLALALLGSQPALLYYAQEARMYSLAVCWLLLAWVAATQFRQRPTHWAGLGYLLVASAGLYTHYAVALGLIALNVGQLWALRKQPNAFKHWILLQLAALAIYAPWLPTAIRQIRNWPGSTETAGSSAQLWQWLWLGPLTSLGSVPLVVQALLAGLLLTSGLKMHRNWHWWLALVFPLAVLLGMQRVNAQTLKFCLVALPFGGLVLAGLSAWQSRWQSVLWSGLVLCSCAWGGWNAYQLATQPALQRDNYKAIVQQLQQQPPGQTAVLLVAPNQVEVYAYYQPDLRDIYPLPRTRPADPAALQTELSQLAKHYPRFSALFWASEQADPTQVIETWLNANLFKGSERWVGNLRWVQYAAPLPTDQPLMPLHTQFGTTIALQGVAQSPNPLHAGEILALRLIWQATQPLPHPYKTFVHLYADPQQPPIAQLDRAPVLSETPTADQYGLLLPADLAAGSYQLAIGWYDPSTGQRLLLPDGQDRFFLIPVQVAPN